MSKGGDNGKPKQSKPQTIGGNDPDEGLKNKVRPRTYNADLRNLPAALEPLKGRPRWVLWRWKKEGNRWSKPLYQINGRYASSDAPETWCGYDEVINAVEKFDGIGYVIGDGDAAVDLDHCRDAETGDIHPWAAELVNRMGTYTEVSPSGTGLRIIGISNGERVHRKFPVSDGVSCELYRKEAVRYITITGNRLEASADALADITAVFDGVYAELDRQDQDRRQDQDNDELERTIRDGGEDRYGGDRSRALWFVICGLIRRGHCRERMVPIILDIPGGIADHIAEQRDAEDYVQRQVERGVDRIEFSKNDNGKPHASIANIRIAFAKLGVTLRYDQFAGRNSIEGLDGFGPGVDDAAADRLWVTMDQRFGFRPPRDLFTTVVADTARTNAYHPVRNYLDGLRWDGVNRVDTWLTTYSGAEDTVYVRAVSALTLIAAVRRIRQPGCKFDEMLVLEGEQGTGRSTLVATLAVREEWFSDDVPLNVDAQKVIERISGKWIIEAAELNGIRKGEVEHHKAFLSRRWDRARMAYGRLSLEAARQCVFIGTVNDSKYLRDTTGNRRTWPVKVGEIDIDGLTRDRDQLWAEAAAREANGESIRLDRSLWPVAAIEQSARMVHEPFDDVLHDAIGHLEGKIATTGVWEILDLRAGQRTTAHDQRMTDAMKRLGWSRPKSTIRIDGKVTRGFVKGPEPWEAVTVTRSSFGDRFLSVEGGREIEGAIVRDDSAGDDDSANSDTTIVNLTRIRAGRFVAYGEEALKRTQKGE